MYLRKYLKIFFPLIIGYFTVTLAACANGFAARMFENRFVSFENNYQVIKLDEKNWRADFFTNIAYINKECDGKIFVYTIKTRKDVPDWHRLASGSLDKFANRQILSLKSSKMIDEFSLYKEINISGAKALEVEYKGLYQGKDIYIKNKEYFYILRYIITASNYDKYLEDFKKLVDSFEFLK